MERDLWVKGRVIPLFWKGKNLEIRAASRFMLEIRIGDTLFFNNRAVRRKIKAIRRYSSFTAMIGHENPECIWPGATMEEIIKTLREMYPPEVEKKGVLVFELSR